MAKTRAYEFLTGFEASAQPDAGTPTLPNDLVTLSYLDAYSERMKKVGSMASPVLVSAGTAIDPTYEDSKDYYLIYVAGNGGAVEMSAVPQIVAPPREGIVVQLVGTSNTNTVRLVNGANEKMNGGRALKQYTTLSFISLSTLIYQETGRD